MVVSEIKSVVIVGAGPGGLLLARYLQIHHLPCIIYEREESATARQQGGSLDLHDESGLKALRETGLLDEASTMMRGEGEAMKIVDKDGKVWWDENDYAPSKGEVKEVRAKEAHGRPEIDRTDLRNLLLRSLEPGTVKWGYGVKSCLALSKSEYEITFYNGERITTSILVGADGTFSKVRPLLHNTKIEYSGTTMYDMHISPSNMTDSIREYVGVGACMVLDAGKGLIPQMNSGGKCKVYPWLTVQETWLDEHPLPEEGKKEWIANLFEGWHPSNREVIFAVDEDDIVPRKVWQFPPNLSWTTENTGVTVIELISGDAAHVMPPFGEGVNQGKTLVRVYTVPRPSPSLPPFPLSLLPISHSDPDTPTIRTPNPKILHRELRNFEKRMMNRVRPLMREAQEFLKLSMGDKGGAKAFRDAFIWMLAREISKAVVMAPYVLVSKLWVEED